MEEWIDLVPTDRLARWMDANDLEGGPIEDLRPLSGGTQNVLLRFRRGAREFVLRRPAPHAGPRANQTMRREARLLGALSETDVPHPRLIAACLDEEVIGATAYLMEPIEGFNPHRGLPGLHASDRSLRRGMGLALVDGIARLGRVDPVAVGLADFGKADGYLERQAARWQSQLESYVEYSGWSDAAPLPAVAQVGEWLAQNCPARFQPGLIHGDYHLSNVLVRWDSSELAAIVDWELATLGDPLVDLGWVLATWPDPEGPGPSDVGAEPWDGFPDREELVEAYAAGSSRDLSNLLWYKVLGCYKLGIILEGTKARAIAGLAAPELGDELHQRAVGLMKRAVRWLDQEG